MIERFSSTGRLPPWVLHEHFARYHFAARYVAGKAVVDFACGEGIGSRIFAAAGAQSVEALDASADTVARARSGAPPQIHFSAANALHLPLPEQSSDLFICLETLEHLPEIEGFLREVLRVLRPDGLFLCSTPNRTVTNPGTALTDAPFNPHHTREYSKQELGQWLSRFFGQTDWYGQNPSSLQVLSLLASFRALGKRLPARLRQAAKTPLWLIDSPARHRVQSLQPDREYEYLLAVCRTPQPL